MFANLLSINFCKISWKFSRKKWKNIYENLFNINNTNKINC